VEKIQLLFIEECPNSEIAWKNLNEALRLLQIAICPDQIVIHDDLEADTYSFQGSPSIKINGVDLWERKMKEYHIGCRIYTTPSGLSGYPTVDMLVESIKKLI
jgi:hypothetical protein